MGESLQVLVGLRTRKASGWIFLTLKKVGFMNKICRVPVLHQELCSFIGNLHVGPPSSRKLYVVQNPLAEAFPK
jgi:hypothetical protein